MPGFKKYGLWHVLRAYREQWASMVLKMKQRYREIEHEIHITLGVRYTQFTKLAIILDIDSPNGL